MQFKFEKKSLLIFFILFTFSLILYLIYSHYQMHSWGDSSNLFGNYYELKNNKIIYSDVFAHRGPLYFFFLDIINFFIKFKISNIIYYSFINTLFCILSIIYLLSSIKIDPVKQFLVISIFLIFLLTLGIDTLSFQLFHSGLIFIFIASLFNSINNDKNLNLVILATIMPLIFFSRIDGIIYCIFIFLLSRNNIFKIIILTTPIFVIMFYLLSSYYDFDMQTFIRHNYHYNVDYRSAGSFNPLIPKTFWITKLFFISIIFNFIIFYKNKKINYIQTIVLNAHIILATITFFLVCIKSFIKYLVIKIYINKDKFFLDNLNEEQMVFLKSKVSYLDYILIIIFLIVSWKIYNFYNLKYKFDMKLVLSQLQIVLKDKIEIVLILIFLMEIAKFTLNNITWPSGFLLVIILPYVYLIKNNLGIKNILFYKKLNLFILIIIFGFTIIKYQKIHYLNTNITENYKNKISSFENFIKEEKIDYILGNDSHLYKLVEIKNKNIVYFDQHLLHYDLDLTKYKTAKIYSEKLKKISKVNTKIMIPCFYLQFDKKNIKFININFSKIKEFNFVGRKFCILESPIK